MKNQNLIMNYETYANFFPLFFSSIILTGFLALWFRNKYKESLENVKTASYIDGYVNSMVDTYFYGYLKKIIPNEGLPSQGISNNIRLYKEKEMLTDKDFPTHKMYILITASGYLPPSLEAIDKARIEPRKNLDPLVSSRAGTNGRTYATSVYKIKHLDLKNHITVTMEGAPPLMVVVESCKENPELKKHKKMIIKSFYKKLGDKLKKNPEFHNSYELIFYNDDPEKLPTLADDIILLHIDPRKT